MATTKYVLSRTNDLITVDENMVVFVSPIGRSRIKGTKISSSLLEILGCFKEPSYISDVSKHLKKKYSTETLERMLHFLIEKQVLISEHEFVMMQKYNNSFLEKTLFYTIGGEKIHDIIHTLAKKKVGVIGTAHLVESLIRVVSDSELFSHIHAIRIDEKNEGYSEAEKIILQSDFIFATGKFFDYILFDKINQICFEENKKWMRVAVDNAQAEIGPLFIPGKTCCYACTYVRRRKNMSEEECMFDDLLLNESVQKSRKNGLPNQCTLYPINIIAANIACAEMVKYHVNMKCNLINQILSLDGIDNQTRNEYIFKDYRCATCGRKERKMYEM